MVAARSSEVAPIDATSASASCLLDDLSIQVPKHFGHQFDNHCNQLQPANLSYHLKLLLGDPKGDVQHRSIRRETWAASADVG